MLGLGVSIAIITFAHDDNDVEQVQAIVESLSF
jgi:hypothetical protein